MYFEQSIIEADLHEAWVGIARPASKQTAAVEATAQQAEAGVLAKDRAARRAGEERYYGMTGTPRKQDLPSARAASGDSNEADAVQGLLDEAKEEMAGIVTDIAASFKELSSKSAAARSGATAAASKAKTGATAQAAHLSEAATKVRTAAAAVALKKQEADESDEDEKNVAEETAKKKPLGSQSQSTKRHVKDHINHRISSRTKLMSK
jgi:hypothetical protein